MYLYDSFVKCVLLSSETCSAMLFKCVMTLWSVQYQHEYWNEYWNASNSPQTCCVEKYILPCRVSKLCRPASTQTCARSHSVHADWRRPAQFRVRRCRSPTLGPLHLQSASTHRAMWIIDRCKAAAAWSLPLAVPCLMGSEEGNVWSNSFMTAGGINESSSLRHFKCTVSGWGDWCKYFDTLL